MIAIVLGVIALGFAAWLWRESGRNYDSHVEFIARHFEERNNQILRAKEHLRRLDEVERMVDEP